jgi:hypothetical protein
VTNAAHVTQVGEVLRLRSGWPRCARLVPLLSGKASVVTLLMGREELVPPLSGQAMRSPYNSNMPPIGSQLL